jgi:cell division protein FtsB
MARVQGGKRRPAVRSGHGRLRAAVVRRWLAVVVVGLVAFLYYRPLTHYLHARQDVAQAREQVRALQAEHARLERRLATQTSTRALVREARRLGYVEPGERLFTVKGIPEWRAARRQGRPKTEATIGGDG